MAASGTLYTYAGNHRAFKILVAARYSGANVRVVSESPDFVLGETNKTADFVKKFPPGKVPAFETSDGQHIYESNAIAYYVGNDQLRGATAIDRAHVIQWINFADNDIYAASCTWVFPSISIIQPNKLAMDNAKEDVKRALKILDDHFLHKTFLVGERITQADISVLCTLLQLYEHVLEPSIRESYPNLNRWFDTLVHQPAFEAVIGEVNLCKTAAQFDPKKFGEIQSKSGKDKKSGSGVASEKKEKSPKKPEKKHEKSSKKSTSEEAAPEEELDETEAILASEPKSKDPFEVYPKGTFNMDEFKRVYSNEEADKSIPHFWNTFDKDHYSIWYGEYKFPEELSLVFMSCNLITGMFQRLDKMRKNAFGSMILFGSDNNSTISGIWVWRGHDLAFKLSSDWEVDYDSYTWSKLDPDSPETKKTVDEYLSWSGDFGGKHLNQGKIFK